MLLPHWGWGWGAGAVSWRLHSHQDLRVQPDLDLVRWGLASPSPSGLLDLWEPASPTSSLQGPWPLDTSHSHWSPAFPRGLL